MVARNISKIAGRIRALQLPDLKERGDVTDWIEAGGTKDRLIEIAKACPDWAPSPEYDQALAELNNKHGRVYRSANHTISPEDEAQALDTIETAIVAGTAIAVYGDECITSLAMLPEGKRADLIRKISSSVEAVCKRDIKKKVAAKILELSPLGILYTAPEGQLGQLLSPHISIKESCEAALSSLAEHNDPMRLFRRAGRMSRVRPNDQGAMKIEELIKEGISYELNGLIDFYYVNPNDGETKHVTAPKHIIDYLYAHPDLPFSVIDGVTEIPVLRKDGTILDKTGYDEVTRMYYHPPDDIALPPIPENPTPDERKQAAELLREAFCDMPFISETDRTHTIALLLSPILRITGTTPLALINAHQPSNGKSLLADAISLVATGRTANNVTAPLDPREWESFLAALLFSGEPLVFFDNVKHYIESASLEKVLTSEEVTSRVLGKSTALTVINRITFALTGNNVQVGREIARRSYIIDLDAQMSNPEDRSADSYRHPDLKLWIRENRGRIVWSLFVIIRAWFADGCPRYLLPQMGSFEKWCLLIGNIITHAGFGGFLGNRDRLRSDSDQESAQWEAFLERWIDLYGDSQKPVSAVAFDMTCDDKLGGVIPEDLSYCIKGIETNNVKIGRVFKRRDGSRFGLQQMRLCQGPIIRGQRMWTVLREIDLSATGAAAEERKADLIHFADPDEPTPTHSPIFGVDTLDLAHMPDDWDEDDE